MHIRSNSFPPTTHPLISQFEEHLNRLKSSEAASSSSSITKRLGDLQDLYESTEKLLQLSTIQHHLARERSEKSIQKMLEGSLVLLDICSMFKDCLARSKDGIQELQSVMRRMRGAESEGFTLESGKYLASRKKMKKVIRKALGNLKAILKDSSNGEDNESSSVFGILKEAEAITVRSLECLLLFIMCDPKGQYKQRKWSLISKMMQPKKVACDCEELGINEFEKVDSALESLIINHKHSSSMRNFQSHFENLEMCINDLEHFDLRIATAAKPTFSSSSAGESISSSSAATYAIAILIPSQNHMSCMKMMKDS
ncbi:uncharacterized protein G2W53_003274 [Senna tora]|uniref:DUF241 domain protein n=1 Tax=Senna tora TaxID=362788 RepID=A0A835CGS6_9FABA|nr:uncharacterized protein G2W53_003274 [Senna tora]